ncbi:major capsid protein [Streptomyces phage Kardashian]|nr:major capsid protein [Streptomyces phage Kardashian]
MAVNRKPDFSGYATKAGLKCSDGRTIMPNAFQHMDGMRIPLVWQHAHNDPENVLGHAILEARDDGMYAHGFFNNTPKAQAAKQSVEHEDINSLSIYANQLVEKAKQVVHGMIREVSLVLAGANPGAKIDFVNLQHSDGSMEELEDEAVVYTGLTFQHADEDSEDDTDEDPDEDDEDDDTDDEDDEDFSHADGDEETVQSVYDSMTEDQKNVTHYLIGVALQNAAKSKSAAHSDNQPGEGDLSHQEGADDMSRNVFDQTDKAENGTKKHELSHDALEGIFADARNRGSLKAAVEHYAEANLQHGITDIDVLFPDAKMATGTIELEKRRTEWVAAVLNGTRHTPFSRIKTFTADLRQEEARAKGYIKGNYKLEEWIGVTKRTTGPTTIYKKQKLDRDDILDITDFDVVAFLKGEMRLMTEEEIARAILIGDGRSVVDEDKIKDPLNGANGDGIRSIINDHELFVTTLNVNVDNADSSYEEVVDAVMDGMEYYKGTGTPTFFTTIPHLNMFKKARDEMGRRYYETNQQVADALGVKAIVTVEPMKEISDLVGIIVNLDDYNVGTDKGGELTMFEDFDIDYNQQKYLLETRMSGALVRPKSAIVIRKTAAANVLVSPNKPAFNKGTGVVTIPTQTGVVYKDGDGTTLTAGPQTALAAGESTTVYAVPDTGYYFADNQNDSWEFTRPAA